MTTTITRDDWKVAREALDVIEAERADLLKSTEERFHAAQETLILIEEQIGAHLLYCEGCSEPIFSGDAYHTGEDVAPCSECAPSYADMLASPENFRGDNDEAMTADEAQAIAGAHVAAGGSLEDKMVSS